MSDSNDNALWRPYAGQALSCSPKTLHLWRIDLEQSTQQGSQLLSSLSDFEQARAKAFYTDELRRRFVMRRAALRHILSAYLDVPPNAHAYAVGLHGKPSLPDAAIHFNLSHSQDVALIGIAQCPIGVDIEHVVAISDLALVATRHFTEREQQALFSLPQQQHLAAFYRCWTRKEAFIKADGSGLALPLKRFAVTLKPDEPAAFQSIDLPNFALDEWHLLDIPLPAADHLIGAVAAHTRFDRILCWSFSDWANWV